MTETEKSKLLDKVRKLIALSKSPNENEASLAAEKAQALVSEYNLSMIEVMADSSKPAKSERIIIDKSVVTPSNPWRRRLAQALATLYFCSYYYETWSGRNIHCFVGTEANVSVTKLMFEYLLATINRLANEGSRKVPDEDKSPYRVSFREACTSRLCSRIHYRIEDSKEGGVIKTEKGTTLPALLDLYTKTKELNAAFIKQNVGELTSRKTKVSYLHSQGVREGDEAGSKISLEKQIGGHSDQKRLN